MSNFLNIVFKGRYSEDRFIFLSFLNFMYYVERSLCLMRKYGVYGDFGKF